MAKSVRSQFMSLADAAKALGMQKSYLYTLAKKGQIKCYRSGRWFEVSEEWVKKFALWRHERDTWRDRNPMPTDAR